MEKTVGKRKIACLITGVPRGFQRCFETLRFLLAECDVTYFAVIREEFATEETVRCLNEALPGLKLIVVPLAESQAATATRYGKIMNTVVQMWHETWYGTNAIENKGGFDFIFRTRFDLFFHRQFLPVVGGEGGSVWIPENMSWSGSNDMLCLAPPEEFAAYAAVYTKLERIAQDNQFTPEAILNRSIALAGLTEQKLDVFFILYREVMFGGLSDRQLQALTYVHPLLSVYKLGDRHDSEARRRDCVAKIISITRAEALMPVFSTANGGGSFFETETDARDGRPFRWMAQHAQARRALVASTREIRFAIHFWIQGWVIEHLRVAIDGNAVTLRVAGHDAFGRPLVRGTIDRIRPFRRPWSRITFCSALYGVPSELGTNQNDHRNLSVALGDFEFVADADGSGTEDNRQPGTGRPLPGISRTDSSSIGVDGRRLSGRGCNA